MDSKLTQADLSMFTGSDTFKTWSILFPRIDATEGVLFLARKGGAYWLLDAIASHIVTNRQVRETDPQFWELKKNKTGKGAKLTCVPDSGMKPVAVQRIEYTDFPLDSVRIWVGKTEKGWRLMLPSEY